MTNPYNMALQKAEATSPGVIDNFKRLYFEEIARVMEPGGKLIVSTNVSRNPFGTVLGPDGRLLPELEEMGFKIDTGYGPLHPALEGESFFTWDAQLEPGGIVREIPSRYMETIILIWER